MKGVDRAVNARPSFAVLAVAVLLIAAVAGWIFTRDVNPLRPAKKTTAPAARVSKVDQRLLQTARQLAALGDTHAEQELATEALRLSNQEVDQDFATSIREAAAIPPPKTGPLHDLAVQIKALQARVTAGQQLVAQLTKDAASNSSAAGRLQLASAQLTLDQDELADAQQDLERAGGDEHANLEHAQQALQAARQSAAPMGKLAPAGVPGALREQIQLWLALDSREDQIQAARQEAEKKAATLSDEHKQLEGKLTAAPAASPDDQDQSDSDDTATVVAQLRGLSDVRKTLADLDKRTQICQQLGNVYQQWLPLVADRRRGVLHGLIGSFSLMLAIMLAATVVKDILERILGRQADKRRVHQLSVVSRIAVHAVAAILILLVIFGAPTQTPTIIGLAGAGLTVVLKDFIVAFFGWFVLMGKNGIGLGDWVEINGVGGEVIEVGILRTTLLEMGNWTSTGHPTGRRVSFMNGFAIEGHYFNFSTAGQWLWDELQVTLPSGGDPYRMAEQIRQIVERETEEDAKLAEQDWERVTRQYGTRAFSARPAADLRPSPGGLVVNMRYITRGPLRYEAKSRLFKAIVELMHGAEKGASV
ncbi:MAG TPA: mechanosensitive ion channel domain-containing protein [Bryobacteraceae bacterium]|nr:mechanosensitive ion channel domain-containing protein [Bryobacteraceae bacterium]